MNSRAVQSAERAWQTRAGCALAAIVVGLAALVTSACGLTATGSGPGSGTMSGTSIGVTLTPSTNSPAQWAQLVAGGPSARVAAGGLVMTLTLEPGPYFLSELVAEQITLTNSTTQAYQLQGVPQVNDCSQALWTQISGGGPPTYTLPTGGFVSCPMMMSTLAPGQTWTIDDFLPVTASGRMSVTAGARFIVTATATDGTTYQTGSDGPFANRWPALDLDIAARIPASHTIALHAANHSVIVDAPSAAQANLYYIENVGCQQGQGSEEMPRLSWQHLTGAALAEPTCDGTNETWSYSVSAPGYAIASGQMG